MEFVTQGFTHEGELVGRGVVLGVEIDSGRHECAQ
jgi:hypothetical protein